MKEHTYLQEEEMVRRAVDALLSQLGPVETARFLTLPQPQRMDSAIWHRLWQDSLGRDRFFEQVFGPCDSSSTPSA